MYKTLLQSQVLGVQNPHTIIGGSVNDNYGSQENLNPVRLTQEHKVLNFSENRRPLKSTEDFEMPAFAGFEQEKLLSQPYTK